MQTVAVVDSVRALADLKILAQRHNLLAPLLALEEEADSRSMEADELRSELNQIRLSAQGTDSTAQHTQQQVPPLACLAEGSCCQQQQHALLQHAPIWSERTEERTEERS